MSILTNPDFLAANKASIKALNLTGEVYAQNASVYFPINGVYNLINAFTFYQHNTFDECTKQFVEIQAWPRLLTSNGEIAWALQKILIIPQGPSYRFEKGSKPVLEKQTYSVEFIEPVLIDSAVTQVDPSGGTPIAQCESISDTAKMYEVSDHATGTSLYSETNVIMVDHKLMHYNNYVQVVVDASGANNQMLYVHLSSHGGVAPQVIADAMNAFINGTIQMRDDPANPGQLVPLYIASLDGSTTIPTVNDPECSCSKNNGFVGHCIAKDGAIVIPQ